MLSSYGTESAHHQTSRVKGVSGLWEDIRDNLADQVLNHVSNTKLSASTASNGIPGNQAQPVVPPRALLDD